jgi:hypothetical protein
MLPAVEEDLAVAVDVALEQEEHVRAGLEDAPGIRRLTRHARRQAQCLGSSFDFRSSVVLSAHG